MEYQADLSADAPIDEVLRLLEGVEPVIAAQPSQDALVQCGWLRLSAPTEF